MSATDFTKLLKLCSNLYHLSNENICKFIAHLLKQDHISHKKYNTIKSKIVSGIFRSLYNNASIPEHGTLIERLYLYSEQLCNTYGRDPNCLFVRTPSIFDCIPDSLLSQIGSYLTQNELFGCWNHVCRKFIETGMRPETTQHLVCSKHTSALRLEKFRPAYNVAHLFSRVKIVDINEQLGPRLSNTIWALKSVKQLQITC